MNVYQSSVGESVQEVRDHTNEESIQSFNLDGFLEDVQDTSVVHSVQLLLWELVHQSGPSVVQRKGKDSTIDGSDQQTSDWVDKSITEGVVHVLLDLVVWVDHH